uniref:Uncharacterized protein n=1 Tax=Lygus hesperus TaxID=30085 RepID=A0A146KW64_LYGHE
MSQMNKHIGLDFDAVDEVTALKHKRRRGRLCSTLQHLTSEGAIHTSLPYIELSPATPASFLKRNTEIDPFRVNDKFTQLVFLGSSYARREVMDRVARLMVNISALELSAVVQFVLS